MTEVGLMPGYGQPLGTAGLTARPPLTLAEQHVLLLWQVTARAEELLTAAADGRWPGAELAALAGYAQAEVLRQASDEEALLFSAAPARAVAGPAGAPEPVSPGRETTSTRSPSPNAIASK